jgi:hypothetical protein
MSRLHENTYKSEAQDWKTDPAIIDKILNFIGLKEFTMDVCCTEINVPAEYHCMLNSAPWGMCLFGDLKDGLKQKWEGTCWMNPPYGSDLKKFIEKAAKESKNCEVWTILPCRTETKYYQELILQTAGFVVFLEGKPCFIKDNMPLDRAPFAVMIAYFGKNTKKYIEKWAKEKPLKGTIMAKYEYSAELSGAEVLEIQNIYNMEFKRNRSYQDELWLKDCANGN